MLALVILHKRMEATIEVMNMNKSKKISKELNDMLNSYLNAIGILNGSHMEWYADHYYAIMALRRELPSVSKSKELTDELNNAIKLLKHEEAKKLSR
jgi:phosphotransacetylase